MDVFELPDPEPQDYTVTIVVVIVLLVLIIIVAGNIIIIIIMSCRYHCLYDSVPHSPCQEQQQMVLQQWWK